MANPSQERLLWPSAVPPARGVSSAARRDSRPSGPVAAPRVVTPSRSEPEYAGCRCALNHVGWCRLQSGEGRFCRSSGDAAAPEGVSKIAPPGRIWLGQIGARLLLLFQQYMLAGSVEATEGFSDILDEALHLDGLNHPAPEDSACPRP